MKPNCVPRMVSALLGGLTRLWFLALLMVVLSPTWAEAQDAAATYLFNDTLQAEEPGVAALQPVDPLALNRFEDATVFGLQRRVFHFDGNADPPSQQGGLRLRTTGLVPGNNYSVEMVFAFFDRPGQWRRILDVQNRQADAGFYVNPGDHVDVFPSGSGSNIFTNNEFHHVVLTVANTGDVKAYLDGALELTVSTAAMNINNPSNPDDLLNFFLDNLGGGPTDEYSTGLVALIRLYADVLTDEQVAQLAGNPFP